MTEEDKAPSFFEVNDRNIRNNFGQAVKDREIIEKDIEAVNQGFYNTPKNEDIKEEPRTEIKTDNSKLGRTIAIILVIIVVVVVVIGIL